eukprot:CAMPEP_0117561652 /NCGR_PEP_ID=MMETSP0784-20121206/54533_1 /TAXON_ID=39447 /ORGANISM="" /LENGTH=88 /DNA_ID=CAMNT_0005359161 /DNA_START=78 /DNA_END=344 /DNA_ORIENTATION=+
MSIVAATQFLRRAAAGGLARGVMGASVMQPSQQLGAVRAFAKSAAPETPLMHYTATQQATSSINHRLFYVNVIAMVFVVDAGSAMLDI